jgi:flavin-dependent dehydrogenase
MNAAIRDVAILGGGLAGLTLALQLKRQHPDFAITVLERATHPVPEAAHKVGESTVEIGAHYFAEVLGQREHLETCQLRKFSLRYFFNSASSDDLATAMELGPSQPLAMRSYQIDRGIFENHLAREAIKAGIEFLDGCTCKSVDLADGDDPHQVHYRRGEAGHSLGARWVVDALSRASVLKRQLGLAQDNGHHVNAVWFRVAARIDLGEWSTDAAWQARCTGAPRWLSTNHLMGPGYWVWLIPLASGSTSVGIVVDPDLHPLEPLRQFDGAMQWLHRHQPRCARAIEEHRGGLQDFRFLKTFSHGCKQVFSAQRWALTGEAGVFLDPFYSPGSDYIAISNTLICDLIQHQSAGHDIRRLVTRHTATYDNLYQAALSLYREQYPLFGNRRVMALKTTWDYACYWGVVAQIFLCGKIADFQFMVRHAAGLSRFRELNAAMQELFRAWAQEPDATPDGVFVNQNAMPALMDLNRAMTEPLDGEALDARMHRHFDLLEGLANEITRLAPARAMAKSLANPDATTPGGAFLTGFPAALLG